MSIFGNLFGWSPFGGGTDPAAAQPGGLLDGGSRMPALYNGLLTAGGAMLAGGDPRYPQTFGSALGRGFLGLGQGIQTGQDNAARNQYMHMHAQNYANLEKDRQAQAARDAAEQQQVDAYIATLPPEQQQMARLAPKEVIAQQLKTMFPDDNAPKTVGGMMWDSKTKSYQPIPGFTEQAKAIAEAGRAPPSMTINQAQPVPKTLEERDQQVLLHGDPSSPEYAMAYTRTFMNPRFVQGTDAQGNATMVPIMPAVPPNIRKPSYQGGAGQGALQPSGRSMTPPGPTTGPAAAAPATSGAGPTPGQPIITGIAKGQTEDARKNQQLYTRTIQQLPIVMKNFDELAKLGNQAGSAVPLVRNWLTSGGYQEANNALTDIAASYLYSVSGATANPGEVANLVKTVTPTPGEDPASVADKKARIQQMVESIKVRAGNTPGSAVSTAAPGAAVIWSRGPDGKLVQEPAP